MLLSFNLMAVAMTLLGGLLPLTQKIFSREALKRLFSLRSGILLAIVFTEVLPESLRASPFFAGWGALGAFLLLYAMASFWAQDTCLEYIEDCRVHILGWAALAALSIHAFLDGLNLSFSFNAGAFAGTAIGITLALHKLADGFTLTSLFRQAGFSPPKNMACLFTMAFATPLGALLGYQSSLKLGPEAMALMLGFASGSFLYIAAADILPRLHTSDDRTSLVYFGVGLFGVAAIRGF